MRCTPLLVLLCGARLVGANGRPPATNGVFFKPGDSQTIYVATTFGLMVSPDSCHFYWICEQDIGIGGGFDPHYAVSAAGTIFATTFHGVRISRDGGCSFTTDLDAFYAASLSVGPTGDVWVGTSNTGSGNAVFSSFDDGQMFIPLSTMPGTMWFPSLATAPSDPMRVYVSGFQIAADAMPPSAHLFRTDDRGTTWKELTVTGLSYASEPRLEVGAVDPSDANIVYLISRLASPPYGDVVYRTDDGGVTINQVFATASSINGLVVRSGHRVYVTTQTNGLYNSPDGTAFTSLSTQLQFGCLGERSDATLFACASDYAPDYKALASSQDGTAWAPAMQFEYLTGTLDCPAGTAENDVCAGMFSAVGVQLGVQDSQCSVGSGGPPPDAPTRDAAPSPRRSTGCCDAGPPEQSILVAFGVLGWLRRRGSRKSRTTIVAEAVNEDPNRMFGQRARGT